MKQILNTKDFCLESSAVCLGKFDGIHKGHRLLIEEIRKYKKEKLSAVVFTFALHPSTLFSKEEIKLIDTREEKIEKLEKLGVDVLVSYPFTRETAAMEPEEFIREVLVKQLGSKVIVVGKDFHFGYQRTGNVTTLENYAEEYGYKVVSMEKIQDDHQVISSTRIRQEIKSGNMEKVTRLLGEPYTIVGEVVHGKQLGRTIGMPTINQDVPEQKIIPPKGVYVSRVYLPEGEYRGITNVGNKPTVSGEQKLGVETHIIDYSGDLYGKKVKVCLYEFVRAEQKFASVEELKAQMHRDMEYAKKFLYKKAEIC